MALDSDNGATPTTSTPTNTPTNTPTPTPAANLTPNQPTAPTPQTDQSAITNAPVNPASSLHARLFDGILKTLSGGPVKVLQTDPVTGDTRQVEVPQSKSSMGKAVVAAVLSGMFAGGDKTSPGAGGAPRNDPAKQLSEGFQAGKQALDQRSAAAQKLQDDMQTRKLTTVGNNIKLAQQASAMALQQHKSLDDIVARNNSTILADAKEWDSQQDGNDPSTKAIIGQGMTLDEAMNALHGKMTSQNAFIDGTVDVRNPVTGEMEPHPTYSILNPDVKIKLSQKTTDELAKFNKSYENLYEVTGGNVQMPLRMAVQAMHTANTLTNAEQFFDKANNELYPMINKSGSPKPIDLAAAVKNDRSLLPAIDAAEKGMAAGAPMYRVLDAVRNSPQGAKLIGLLGVTPEVVDKYIQDKANESSTGEAVAKAGGKLAEDKLKAGIQDAMIDTTARNILADPNNMASLDKITSLRGDTRTKLYNKLEELSGGTFNIEAAKTKASTYESFNTADGKDRNQIQSYGTFLKHDANLVDTISHFMRPGNTPYWIDKPLNWIEQYVGSDPDILEMKARLLPVKDEFLNFIKGGKAAFLPEVDEMSHVVDGDQSLRAIVRVAQTLGETGMDRLDSLNSTYKQNFGQNYPNLFDRSAAEAATKLGLGSRLQEYGVAVPQTSSNDPSNPTSTRAQVDLSKVPNGKVPIYDRNHVLAGYADDAKGTNYNAFK